MTHEYYLDEDVIVVEASNCSKVQRWFRLYWKYLVLILTPLLCCPILVILANEEAIAAFLLLVMATYWATEALPLPVTALIPVFYLPLTGIMTTEDVTMLYMKASTMMFITSVIVALSIEEVGLHKRVAINTLLLFGGKVEWLILGFVLPTWFLSLWISNVATTSMMLPCTTAVLLQLSESHRTVLKMVHSNEKHHHQHKKGAVANGNGVTINNNHQAVEKTHELNRTDKFTSLETLQSIVIDTPNGSTTDVRESSNPAPLAIETPPTDSSDTSSTESETNSVTVQMPPEVVQEAKQQQQANGMRRNKSSFFEQVANGMRRNKSSFFELAPYQHEEAERYLADLAKAFTLAVAYAANVGGVGTSVGTTPNIVMKGFADSIWRAHGYPESPVNFATWMIIGFPVAVFNLLFLLGWFQFSFVGFRKTLLACVCFSGKRDTTADEAVKKLLRREKEALGAMRFEEIVVAVVFTTMVLLWFFRSPGFMPGWGDLPIFKDGYIHETVVSCIMVVVLFIISPKLPKFCANPSSDDKRPEGILTWKIIDNRFPWGILFLFGGGFALAEACTISGLSKWMGDQLSVLGNLPPWLMLTIICMFTITLANVMSSSATCSLLCPIVASMAESMGKNPLYLMFPVAISSSVAFLLPISNPTNALAYSRRKFSVIDMIKNGAPLTIFGIFTVVFFTLTVGNAFYDWETYPWEFTGVTDAVTAATATGVLCNTVPAA